MTVSFLKVLLLVNLSPWAWLSVIQGKSGYSSREIKESEGVPEGESKESVHLLQFLVISVLLLLVLVSCYA